MTSISKNVYNDKLTDIVNKYNNTYHSKTKGNPVVVRSSAYIDFNKEINKEDTNYKVGDHVRISQYKTIFANGYTPNWSEEVLVIKKVKSTVPWMYVMIDLNCKKLMERFLKKNCKKKKKKITVILLTVGLIKKKQLHKMSYFAEPYTHSKNKSEAELDLSNYETKSDLKNEYGELVENVNNIKTTVISYLMKKDKRKS